MFHIRVCMLKSINMCNDNKVEVPFETYLILDIIFFYNFYFIFFKFYFIQCDVVSLNFLLLIHFKDSGHNSYGDLLSILFYLLSLLFKQFLCFCLIIIKNLFIHLLCMRSAIFSVSHIGFWCTYARYKYGFDSKFYLTFPYVVCLLFWLIDIYFID